MIEQSAKKPAQPVVEKPKIMKSEVPLRDRKVRELWLAADQMREFKRYAAAEQLYRLALRNEATNMYVLNGLATNYLLQGHTKVFAGVGEDGKPVVEGTEKRLAHKHLHRAMHWASKALEVNPNYGPAHLTIAQVYACLEQYDEALQRLKKIEDGGMIPNLQNSGFYVWKGYTLLMRGNRQLAMVALRKAMEIDDMPQASRLADRMANPEDYETSSAGQGITKGE